MCTKICNNYTTVQLVTAVCAPKSRIEHAHLDRAARAERRRRPSVSLSRRGLSVQARVVWATRAGAALAIVPAVRLAAVGRRVIQTPRRQCVSNGGLRMECTRGAASGCRHRPPPVICLATSWVNPLVARRSNFVCASKLAQKLTSLPAADWLYGPPARLLARNQPRARRRRGVRGPRAAAGPAGPGRRAAFLAIPAPRQLFLGPKDYILQIDK
jgi:hypothetical protein